VQLTEIAAARENDKKGRNWRELAKDFMVTASATATLTSNLLGHSAIQQQAKAEESPQPKIVIESPLKRQENLYVSQEATDFIQEWAKLRDEHIITQDEFRTQERRLLAGAYDRQNEQRVAPQLRKLAQLTNKGIISEEAFNQLRSILLGDKGRIQSDFYPEAIRNLLPRMSSEQYIVAEVGRFAALPPEERKVLVEDLTPQKRKILEQYGIDWSKLSSPIQFRDSSRFEIRETQRPEQVSDLDEGEA
jgi:hypothetical protein